MVKYGKPKHNWGRSFPYKSLGLSCFRKIVRNNNLINDYYYDFDLKNAQSEIIRLLCESNNIPCPIVIRRYCVVSSNSSPIDTSVDMTEIESSDNLIITTNSNSQLTNERKQTKNYSGEII